MLNQFQGQNLFKVKLISDILPGVSTDEAEYYFDIAEGVNATACFVYVEFQNESNRETIEVHRVGNSGTRLYYYQYNREFPSRQHEADVFVQINSVAQYVNVIMQNVDNLGRTRRVGNPGMKVRVYGGSVEDFDSQYISVGDKILTVIDGDNYIYYDHVNNEFALSPTMVNDFDLMSKVIALSGNITSIIDLRSFKVRLKNGSVLRELADVGGNLTYKGKALGGGSGTGDVISAETSVSDGDPVVFSGPLGKTIRKGTPVSNAIVNSTSNVLKDTVYQAGANGGILAGFIQNANTYTHITIYSDSNPSPTTVVYKSAGYSNGVDAWTVGFNVPILPNMYYKVVAGSADSTYIKFYYKS